MTPHPFGSLPHKDLVTLNDYSTEDVRTIF